jgi:Ca2+-binding EF-hand superfamily protein
MNKLTPIVLLFAATLTAPAIALAMHGGDGKQCMHKGTSHFSEADTNKDGSLDKAEAQAMHEKRFEQMDTNHDGKIDSDEMKSGMYPRSGMGQKGRKGPMGFMNADKDNDGTLDRSEAQQLPRVQQNFDDIDVDKSGTVSHDEVYDFMMMHR